MFNSSRGLQTYVDDSLSVCYVVTSDIFPSSSSSYRKLVLQAGSNDLMQKAQIFLYANGKDRPPTAIDLDKSFLSDLLFNQSPAKVLPFSLNELLC